MQNPNLTATNMLWVSACGASLLWFLYWIFYDLIVWGKQLVQVNPLNYLGVGLALTFMLFSGLGVRKIEAICYLGSTASFLWFAYWISYDLFVWNKTLSEINAVNYVGVILSLALVFVPKAAAWKSKQRVTVQKVTEQKQKKVSRHAKGMPKNQVKQTGKYVGIVHVPENLSKKNREIIEHNHENRIQRPQKSSREKLSRCAQQNCGSPDEMEESVLGLFRFNPTEKAETAKTVKLSLCRCSCGFATNNIKDFASHLLKCVNAQEW